MKTLHQVKQQIHEAQHYHGNVLLSYSSNRHVHITLIHAKRSVKQPVLSWRLGQIFNEQYLTTVCQCQRTLPTAYDLANFKTGQRLDRFGFERSIRITMTKFTWKAWKIFYINLFINLNSLVRTLFIGWTCTIHSLYDTFSYENYHSITHTADSKLWYDKVTENIPYVI